MPATLPFKAVLWDMDGVIVDSFNGHYRAWAQLFAEMERPFTLEDFRRTFGMNNRNIFHTLLDDELPEAEFQRLSERKEVIFREGIHGNTKMLLGVADWLERFRSLGILQAVASSAPRENIDVHLDELKIRTYFTEAVSGADLPGKPDPAVFLRAAELLGVPPAACLVIEDAVPGVAAAKSAGMRCVAVLTTTSAEKLSKADLVVPDLTHLTFDHLSNLK